MYNRNQTKNLVCFINAVECKMQQSVQLCNFKNTCLVNWSGRCLDLTDNSSTCVESPPSACATDCDL